MVSTVDTKSRILDAAEELFADRGFAETSLRDITSRAGVNLAAVNYHFGSKVALLGSVFDRRIGPVNEARIRRMAELEKRRERPSLEDAIRAFVTPPFELLVSRPEAGSFVRLAGRAHSDPSPEIRKLFEDQFSDVLRRFVSLVSRALPSVGENEVLKRVHFTIGCMAFTLAWCKRAELSGVSPDEWIDSLVRFTAAGMKEGNS